MSDDLDIKKSGITWFEAKDNIGILTIDNGKYNVLNQPNFLDLNVLKEWLSLNDIYGLIIAGQGRNFSAGADLDYLRESKGNQDLLKENLKKGKEILNYIESLSIITVAAVSGICYGGGLEIALSCQYRIATLNSLFAFPESTLGIMPGMGGTVRLPLKIGKSKALDLIISGRTIDTDEAYEIGLIDKCVAKKEHINAAKEFIRDITFSKPHQQITNIIQSVNNSIHSSTEFAMESEGKLFTDLLKNFRG